MADKKELTANQKDILERMKEGTPISSEDYIHLTLKMMDEWMKGKWKAIADEGEKADFLKKWKDVCFEEVDSEEDGEKRVRTTEEIRIWLCDEYDMTPRGARSFIGQWED